jgi:hypothetical protein
MRSVLDRRQQALANFQSIVVGIAQAFRKQTPAMPVRILLRSGMHFHKLYYHFGIFTRNLPALSSFPSTEI